MSPMSSWLGGALELLPTFEALAVLALRSAALVALGWLGATLLKRALPSVRLALWTAVIVGLVALPVLTATLPAWKILPFAVGSRPAVSSGAIDAAVRTDHRLSSPALLVPEWVSGGDKGVLDWSEWAVLAWALGAIASMLVFLAGLWRLRGLRRAAHPADRDLRRKAESVAGEFQVTRRVQVLVSSRIGSPATWGLWRPVIVVPPTAAEWSADRVRLVLAHEMAHVARGDWCWRLLAQIGCALYWFNPFAWIAARRLRFEQELACDLAVIERGARPSSYAHHLLNIARAAGPGRALPLAALDMARRSQMEGRLMSILADRPARGLRRGLLLPVLSIVAALPVVAAIQPQAPPAPETAPVAPVAAPEAPPAELVAVESLSAPPAPVAPALASVVPGVPKVSPALAPEVAVAPEASAVPKASVATAPVVAPSPSPALAPALAPAVSVYGVLAANEEVAPTVASQAPEAAPVAPPSPAPPMAPADQARDAEIEARIAAKAAEIEALVGPIHEEIERAMEESMMPMMEQMELLELEMRPMHEEMSRIGEEMSRRLEETMPAQLEMEEHARRAEAIALEMEQRSRLTEELIEGGELDQEAINERVREMNESLAPLREQMKVLHREMRDRRHSAAEMQELMAPYREQMKELRENLAPQRERMEELRRQFEPRREEMERIREERMAEIRARLDAMRAELRQLSEERARARRELRDD